MPVPTANLNREDRLDLDDAVKIARSMNPRMAHQLRNIIDRNLSDGGWSDMKLNHALRDRGLVRYTVSTISYRGRSYWKSRQAVTDVKPSQHAEFVWLVYDVMSSSGELEARPLTERQQHVLSCLAERNTGRWWPGCGWSWSNTSQTVRLLQALVNRGLAKRGATAPGDPMFTITETGRAQSAPLSLRVAKRMFADKEKEGAK